MQELGRLFGAARPQAVVVATPHNVHIPGAMVLVAGSVWVLVWSFGRSPRL